MAIVGYIDGYVDGDNEYSFADTTARSDISGIKDGENIDSFSDVESDLNYLFSAVNSVSGALATKQDTISDLSTIRSGATAGSTAYQKPSGGIPKTDLASAVQTSLGKADTAIQDITGKADKVSSATNGNFAGLNASGNLVDSGKKASDFATASALEAEHTLLKDTVGWTGKNKAQITLEIEKAINTTQYGSWNGNTYTTRGVSFTFNDDMSVTINGTNSESSQWRIPLTEAYTLEKGDYIFSKLPTGASTSTFYLNIYNSTDNANINLNQANTELPFSFNGDKTIRMFVYIGASATISNATIYPMISREGGAYEPYHPSVSEELNGINTDISNIKDTIGIGYDEGSVVGIQVDYANKSFTRLAGAVGLSAGSDFDRFNAFGGRRRCTVADNGTINHYYGDTGYAEDGSDGQVMVYQPKFYYKVVPLKLEKQSDGVGYHIRKANYYVSDTHVTGFKVHPAFLDEDGKEVDYVLLGAYEGCLYDVSASAYILDDAQVMDNANDKFSSIAGAKPASGLTQDLTRVKIEQMCQNRGGRWHEHTIQLAAATELLMLIEYGKFDVQTSAIGLGVTSIADGTGNNGATSGSTSSLGNNSGRAASTTFIIDGNTVTYTDDGKTSISYRGEENFYSNMWTFLMGINFHGNGSQKGGIPYVCSDFNYTEAKTTGNYVSAGFTITNVNQYISAFGYGNEDMDWLFWPSESTGANDTLPVGDWSNVTSNLNGDRIASLGGRWTTGRSAGGWALAADSGVGARARAVSGRLAYIPKAA